MDNKFNPNKENKADDFTERINDMKGQINSIKVLLSMNRPIEDFKEVQKSLKNFNETVESFGNKIPETILNDHKNQEKIKFYDEVIEKLKKAQTIEELKSILENY